MAFELLISVGHGDIAAATGIVTYAASQSAFNAILYRVAVFGQIGYLLELLFGTATVVMGTIGLLRCLRLNARDPGTAPIDEHSDPPNDLRQAGDGGTSVRQPEVTVRLERGFLRILDRHRCIVTIHRPPGGAREMGREVWYARGEK